MGNITDILHKKEVDKLKNEIKYMEKNYIPKQKVKENIEKIKDRFNKNFSNKKDKAYFGIAGVNHILDILERIIRGEIRCI